MVFKARAAGISGSIASTTPQRMPMSRVPRSDWPGSSTSPPLITRSNLSVGAIAAPAEVARRPDRPSAAADPESARTRRRDKADIRPPDDLYAEDAPDAGPTQVAGRWRACVAFCSVPCRREAGAYKAPVLGQRRDGRSVLIVELHVQRVEIGPLAFGARRLRDRSNAVLIEQPLQRHLRCAGIMLATDRNQRLVGGGTTLRQRAIGHQRDRFGGKIFGYFRLIEHHMIFDLV